MSFFLNTGAPGLAMLTDHSMSPFRPDVFRERLWLDSGGTDGVDAHLK
jgi:hypothetical protein